MLSTDPFVRYRCRWSPDRWRHVLWESGDEWKKFNTRDGMGIKFLQKAGLVTAIVTQERTKLVARRAEKLAIPEVHQGVMDKLTLVREMACVME